MAKEAYIKGFLAFFPVFQFSYAPLTNKEELIKLYRIFEAMVIDKLFAHLAHRAITAPIKPIYDSYLGILLSIRKSSEFDQFHESRQNKLNKIIGALRFQKSKLHTRYKYTELINDTTTNHLEGINSFFKERIKLFRGFKSEENTKLLIKLLVYYYRFHKFTSSGFKERNGMRPIELNILNNQELLSKILKGNEPYSWIKNLLNITLF